jgi:hypothetical protein
MQNTRLFIECLLRAKSGSYSYSGVAEQLTFVQMSTQKAIYSLAEINQLQDILSHHMTPDMLKLDVFNKVSHPKLVTRKILDYPNFRELPISQT